MAKRRMTKVEELAFLARAFEDASRDWKPGDSCMPLRGTDPVAVDHVEGPIVYLTNGQSMHHSRMRRAE